MTPMAPRIGYIPTDQRVLLLLRVAVALAAYNQHQSVQDDDYAQAARMLGRHRALTPELVDVDCMIA
jgi:hypothetical protein